jgi:hypothetical protein
MRSKLLGGAANVLAVARDVVRHAAWYVRYQVDGTPRDEEGARRRERRPRS